MKRKIMEICENLCCKEITEEEPLILSGLLDSYKLMELICDLESEFHITFLPEEIMELKNFSSVNAIDSIVNYKRK